MSQIRHKTFISYHHGDETEVREFINEFDWHRNTFTTRGIGEGMPGDIIDSDNTTYIMQRIREKYLQDSSVTIVLIGYCTWARRYVDWEIQASLRRGEKVTPNGLLGIVLPSVNYEPKAPDRLWLNLGSTNSNVGYARWYRYPQNEHELASWIEDAYMARTTRDHLIENPRDRFINNRQCS